jgi:hypothetical protein
MSESEHHKPTKQQLLIEAAFNVYQGKCLTSRYPMSLEPPTRQGADLVFHGGRLGAHVGFSIWELVEFMQRCTERYPLYKPGKTRFLLALNDEQWEAFVDDTTESCIKRVDDHYAAKKAEYEASPKYVEDLAKAAADEAANFTRCHHVAYSLDMGFDLYDVANWVATFVEVADYRGALSAEDATHVYRRFQVMNYTEGDGVGTDPKTFEERVRYIVGQVMRYCQKGWPPHAMLGEFAQTAIKDHLEENNGKSARQP